MTPNLDEAIEFLRRFSPAGWYLTRIIPDGEGSNLHAQKFGPDEIEATRDWIEKWNAKGQNIYFQVNPLSKKPKLDKAMKADVRGLAWVHVDIDGEPPNPNLSDEEKAAHNAAEMDRLRVQIENFPPGVPPATAIVHSGNGFQIFWRLGSEFSTEGQDAQIAKAEAYNRQMILLFQGDARCANIDRIMRVPGTVNYPNTSKKKQGKTPVLSSLVEFTDEVYPLSQFTPAPLVNDGTGGVSDKRTQTVEISGNVKRLTAEEIAALPLDDWYKEIIVQGFSENYDLKSDDVSPSAWQWALSCEIVRKGIDDDTHYAILMDPDLGISKTIYKKGSGADRYARKQIARAKDEVDDPDLAEMNQRFAYVNLWDGSGWIIRERYDELEGRSILERMNKTTFFDALACEPPILELVEEETTDGNGQVTKPAKWKKVPRGKWWFENQGRLTYETVQFGPGLDLCGEVYNLWKGFACDAIPGDCSLYLEHVRKVIAKGNEEHYNWVLDWMARSVQEPHKPAETALVLRGGQGTGKGTFITHYGGLFGRHYLQVSDPKRVTGAFNAHLRDCVVLFADEAFYTSDRKGSTGALKALVTEENTVYEVKGKDVTHGKNFIHLVMASNEEWVVPADVDDRRLCVLDVSDEHAQDQGWFRAINEQMRNGGREALLHLLLTRDISNFNHRSAPQTDALKDQKERSFPADVLWWKERLEDGVLVPAKDWGDKIYCRELAYQYKIATGRTGTERSIQTTLGNLLRKWVPKIDRKRQAGIVKFWDIDGYEREHSSPWYYQMPPLAECREAFDELTNSTWDWPNVSTEDEDDGGPSPEDGNGQF